jgi:hypothetical protein
MAAPARPPRGPWRLGYTARLSRRGTGLPTTADRLTTRKRWAAALTGVTAAALLAIHVAVGLSSVRLDQLFQWWHYWSEVSLAIEYLHTGDFPVASFPVTDKPRVSARYRRTYLQAVSDAGIHPWQPLATVASTPVTGERHPLRRFDDPGRPLVMGLAFRLLGGAAPFLIFWLAVVPAFGVFVWTTIELWRAGRAVTGAVLVLLLATSCYVAESLAASYNSAGFHVLALLMLVPFSVYAALRPRPTWRGLVVRSVAVALALGVFTLCRSGCVLVMPGFALAILVAAYRVGPRPASPASHAATWLRAAALSALLPLPFFVLYTAVVRGADRTFTKYGVPGKPLRHDVWCSAWKGLGDFDRTKGHIWDDRFVRRAIADAGGHGYLKLRHERLCLDLFKRDITEDPAWYASILWERLSATTLQSKLWPWTPRDGTSWAPSTHPGEGLMDSYYGLTSTADWFELGRFRVESPILLLLLPLGIVALGAGIPSPARASFRQGLVMLAPIAVAALVLPVFITTAGGTETQAFALVHFIAWALVVEELVRYGLSIRRRGNQDASASSVSAVRTG